MILDSWWFSPGLEYQHCSSPVFLLSFSFSLFLTQTNWGNHKMALLGEQLVMSVCRRLKQEKFHLRLSSPVTADIRAMGLDYFLLYLLSPSPAGRWSTHWYISPSGLKNVNLSPFGSTPSLPVSKAMLLLCLCVSGEVGAPCKTHNCGGAVN